MGTVDTGGSGCFCPEHVILKRLLSHLVISRDEVVIMDMEAGLEHLGRGTAEMMDRFIVVIEPGERSIQTLQKIKQLAKDLGVKQVNVVANKVRNKEDEDFLRGRIPSEELLGFIYYSDECATADRKGASPFDTGGSIIEEIRSIKENIGSLTKSL
jgi:CO dehydrogenase maturation factor